MKFKIYSSLSRNEYININVNPGELEKALDNADSEELARKMGTGIYGWNTYLVLDPEDAEFKVLKMTPNTHLIYNYLYPIYTIYGIYDVPYTLIEALREGWRYYSQDFKPLNKWLKKNKPDYLEIINPTTKEVEALLENLPENLKSEIWEEELIASISEEIWKVLSETTVEDILDFLKKNGEVQSVRKK